MVTTSFLDHEWSLFRLVRRVWRERKPREKMVSALDELSERGTTRSLNVLRKADQQQIDSIVLQVDLGMQDISALRYLPVRV